ncbi:MAG: hypothetical protein JO077_10300 [Verrucomicrobia bacterium]|nr:hypothetical protein [Verrucomicrobiota bacterium]
MDSPPLLITDLLITVTDFPREIGQRVLNLPAAVHLFRPKIHLIGLGV